MVSRHFFFHIQTMSPLKTPTRTLHILTITESTTTCNNYLLDVTSKTVISFLHIISGSTNDIKAKSYVCISLSLYPTVAPWLLPAAAWWLWLWAVTRRGGERAVPSAQEAVRARWTALCLNGPHGPAVTPATWRGWVSPLSLLYPPSAVASVRYGQALLELYLLRMVWFI